MNGDNVDKNVFNAYSGGQVIIANDNSTVYAVQNNDNTSNKIHHSVKSRTQEYANKWNENMFLNDFDKRDENAGVNVKLSDVYLEGHLPRYIWKDNKNTRNDLKDLLWEYVYEKNGNRMLLVLGQPGIGKSTLITWITSHFIDRIDDIIVYKFASDLNGIDWQSSRITDEILEKLGLSYADLNGKTLILDGYDEISISDKRKDILDSLYGDLIYSKKIKKISLIITCRENYIKGFERIKCKYIILQPCDEIQIKSFCNIFQEKTKNIISDNTIAKLLENKEILGVPLVLYMTLSLNISIDQESSITDVYDKIFALEGGVYDRCIDNKKFADTHWISKIKEQIHQISREIAMWMFENNPDEASIPQEKYKKICFDVKKKSKYGNEKIDQDFLIGNFFKMVKHCEGVETEELYFVHRSIYEYFVVETICSSIEKAVLKLSQESQDELAGNIAFYLKKGKITYTIGVYLYSKIVKIYNKMTENKKQRFYTWMENAIIKMMEYGMFFFTNKSINKYKSIISQEINCFLNMLDILRLFSHIRYNKYILENAKSQMIERYVKYCILNCEKNNFSYLNLKSIDLRFANLNKTDLSNANLEKANLCGANLEEADLTNANLEGVNLEFANLNHAVLGNSLSLIKVNLMGANLDGVNLEGYNFIGKNLQKVSICFANLSNANLSMVNLTEADLSESKLCNAILENANMSKMDLMRTDLKGANLQKAILYNSSLNGANLINADLNGANLNEANINDSIWTDDDIQKVLPKLVNAIFKFIFIESKDGEKRKIYRRDLFGEYIKI